MVPPMTDTLKKAEELIDEIIHRAYIDSDEQKELLSLISDLVEESEKYLKIARNIHYPDCWDTMAYPTLYDAINECVGPCNIADCQKRSEVLDELTQLSQDMGMYDG